MPEQVMGVCKRLPARFEVREDPASGEARCVFVVERKNSAQIPHEQRWMIQQLRELAGIETYVDLGLAEVTVEKFEMNGMWAIKRSETVQRPQGKYNRRNELHNIESQLVDMSRDDPQYDGLMLRRHQLKAMLNTAPVVETETEKRERENTERSKLSLADLAKLLEDNNDQTGTERKSIDDTAKDVG